MYEPDCWPREVYWHRSDGSATGPDNRYRPCCLPEDVFERLSGVVAHVPGHAESRSYPDAEVALQDLAQALTKD